MIENDRSLPADDLLTKLSELLDFPPDERDDLSRLREIGKRRGWWASYTDINPEEVTRFYGLEHGARRIRAYEGQIVNGLLQTEDYARELIVADPRVSDVQVNRLLTLRRQRQRHLLEAPTRPHLVAVMNQAVLLQVVGTAATLHHQLEHLIRLEDEPNIDIRIVPFSRAPKGATASTTFYLLDFDRPHLPTVAWLEAGQPLGVHLDAVTVGELSIRHEDAMSVALDRNESLDLIHRCADLVERGDEYV